MIDPGLITIDLFLTDKEYLIISMIVPALFALLAGFTAHLMLQQKKYRTLKAYVTSSLLGLLSYLAVRGMVGVEIESITGLDGLISTAILVGYGGRAILPKLSKRFEENLLTPKEEQKDPIP